MEIFAYLCGAVICACLAIAFRRFARSGDAFARGYKVGLIHVMNQQNIEDYNWWARAESEVEQVRSEIRGE